MGGQWMMSEFWTESKVRKTERRVFPEHSGVVEAWAPVTQDSRGWWKGTAWTGRMGHTVCGHPWKGAHRSLQSGSWVLAGIYCLCALCMFLRLIYLPFLLMLLAISCRKNISTYVCVASLYILFMHSWWVRELILPSRKAETTITFPLCSLEWGLAFEPVSTRAGVGDLFLPGAIQIFITSLTGPIESST